jgi:hypothetical protein
MLESDREREKIRVFLITLANFISHLHLNLNFFSYLITIVRENILFSSINSSDNNDVSSFNFYVRIDVFKCRLFTQ